MKVLVKKNNGKDTLVLTNVDNIEVVRKGDFYELRIDDKNIESSIASVLVRYAQRIVYHPNDDEKGIYKSECGTHYAPYETLYDMMSDVFEIDELDKGYFDISVKCNCDGRVLIIDFVNTVDTDVYHAIESYANIMYSYYGQDDESEAMNATNIDKVVTSIEKAELHRKEFIENYKKHLLINK